MVICQKTFYKHGERVARRYGAAATCLNEKHERRSRAQIWCREKGAENDKSNGLRGETWAKTQMTGFGGDDKSISIRGPSRL